MADIKLTTADQSGFVPQYWAQRALDVLRAQIVLANLVAKDVNFAEPGWKGKSITVPYPGRFTAVDKVADTPATPQVPVGGQSVTLTLAKHKIVPLLVEDFANAQANMDLMDRYIQPAVIALAEQFETDLWATAQGVTGAAGTPGTDMTAAALRGAMKGLNDAKAPTSDRYIAVSTKDQISLLADTNLQTFFAFSQPEGVTNGFLGRLYGMDAYMSQLVPLSYIAGVGAASAGTFTLTFNGQTTGNIAYNASAATVLAAIVAGWTGAGSVPAASASNVSVTGSGPTWEIGFTGNLAGTTLAVTGVGSGLTGGAFTITTKTRNMAFHKNSLMYAVRPFPEIPAAAGVMTAQANDPESGLSIRISTQYDINNVGVRCNLDMLYGTVALRPDQAVIVAS